MLKRVWERWKGKLFLPSIHDLNVDTGMDGSSVFATAERTSGYGESSSKISFFRVSASCKLGSSKIQEEGRVSSLLGTSGPSEINLRSWRSEQWRQTSLRGVCFLFNVEVCRVTYIAWSVRQGGETTAHFSRKKRRERNVPFTFPLITLSRACFLDHTYEDIGR